MKKVSKVFLTSAMTLTLLGSVPIYNFSEVLAVEADKGNEDIRNSETLELVVQDTNVETKEINSLEGMQVTLNTYVERKEEEHYSIGKYAMVHADVTVELPEHIHTIPRGFVFEGQFKDEEMEIIKELEDTYPVVQEMIWLILTINEDGSYQLATKQTMWTPSYAKPIKMFDTFKIVDYRMYIDTDIVFGFGLGHAYWNPHFEQDYAIESLDTLLNPLKLQAWDPENVKGALGNVEAEIVDDGIDYDNPGVYPVTIKYTNVMDRTTIKTFKVAIATPYLFWKHSLPEINENKGYGRVETIRLEKGRENVDWLEETGITAYYEPDNYQAQGIETPEELSKRFVFDDTQVNLNEVGRYPLDVNLTDKWGQKIEVRYDVIVSEKKDNGVGEPEVPTPEEPTLESVPVLQAKPYVSTGLEATDMDYMKVFEASAFDELDGSLTESIVVDSNEVNLYEKGIYPVIFRVANSLGVEVEVKSTLEIVDPLVKDPVVDEPVIDEPVVDEPVIDEPVIDEPVIDEPVIDEPVIDEPVIDEPVIDEPVIDEPVVKEPVVKEPVVKEPVVKEPVIKEPVVKEPVVEVVSVPEKEPELVKDLTAPTELQETGLESSNVLTALGSLMTFTGLYGLRLGKKKED